MNAAQLLGYFDQVSEAADAIPRLRRFILDLAVRGKLAPQDPNDEPARELLTRIAVEKTHLVRAGKIRKDKPLQSVDGEVPFDVPRSWCWTHLGSVTSYIQRGKSPKYAVSNGAPVVSQRCVRWEGLDLSIAKQITVESLADYEEIRFLREGDLLWNSTGTGTIGRVARIVRPPERLVCDSHVTVVRCLIADPDYIRLWLRSDHVYAVIEDRASGSTNQVELTAQMAIGQLVPLPPLAEQRRIVEKVHELMALCDRLEAARVERESTRTRLTTASLGRLNSPDPDPGTFAGHASFVIDNIAALTARPDQIKRLRQTILNLAVRGKLVRQDPRDEPASEILSLITTERSSLVKSGVIAKERSLNPIAANERPFDVPSSWEWVHLGALCQVITKGSSPKWQGVSYVNADEGLLFITSENVGSYHLRKLDDLKYVEARFKDIEPRSMLRRGDILMNLVGASIGRTALYDLHAEANINQAVALIRLVTMFDCPSIDYLLHYFNSPLAIGIMLGSRVTTAQPNISLTDVREFPVPIPPIAEQHRVVARISELVTLCDRLEASLTLGESSRSRLLEAVLHEALAPALEEAA